MASALAKFIQTSASAFERRQNPFSEPAQNTMQRTGFIPGASVFDNQAWNPTSQSVANRIGIWQTQQMLEDQAKQQASSGGQVGQVGTVGGDWAGVDQWNDLVQKAAQSTGVDPNIIKAIMKLESGGNPNAAGSQYVSGLMQVNSDPTVWGSGPWQTDNYQNILKGAQIYKGYLDQYGGDQRMALRGYHGFGSDGNTTDQEYADIVLNNYNQIRNNSSVLGNGTTPGSNMYSSNGWSAITGGKNFPVTQELGLTDFAQGQLGGQYAYSTAYGVTGHAGIDVGTPLGTNLYAPVGGTVQIAGGNPYYTDERYGSTPGTGELLIQLDNGDQLILGHMESIGVQVGQRINPGQYVGQSGFGGAATNGGGPHVHVEYRKRGGNTSSGYTAVDPRQALSGSGVSLTGGPSPSQQQQTSSGFGAWGPWINSRR